MHSGRCARCALAGGMASAVSAPENSLPRHSNTASSCAHEVSPTSRSSSMVVVVVVVIVVVVVAVVESSSSS